MNIEKLKLLGFEKGLAWTYGKSDCYLSTDSKLEKCTIEYKTNSFIENKTLALNRDFDTVESLLECFKKFELFYYEYIYEG
jgi:hypothetical protein